MATFEEWRMSRTAIRHLFDGELLTVAEIRDRVPAISKDAIRDHLAAGRNTSTQMLCFNAKLVNSIASRKRRANPGNKGRGWR
jgi:hypothetical protein